ncbi:MAG: DUF4900 domain-containing protein [Firmicutes bacterium]|nr:DUF4900 domain-containing protein [Bacillota bacterium]
MINRQGRTHRGKNGYALYFSIILLALCIVAAAGLNKIAEKNRKSAEQAKKDENAYYMARTGLQNAVAGLSRDHWWGVSAPEKASFENGKCSYTVSVWAPVSNIHASRKLWKVIATGRCEESSHTITAWLIRKPFTDYVYFSDAENSGDTCLWITDRDKMEGDVHTNGFFSISGRPQFSGKVTSFNNNDTLMTEDRKKYVSNGKVFKDPSRFYHFSTGYNLDEPVAIPGAEKNFSFRGGTLDVPMPDDIEYISQAADKTYNKDIYIKFFDSGKARIRWAKSSGDTVNSGDSGDSQEWENEEVDTLNLTLFSEGKVIIEGGVFRGSCTVASAGDMEIRGTISYLNPKKDLLGLISNSDVVLNTEPYTKQDLNIDAAIMVINGSLYLKNYLDGYPRGVFSLYGCLTQKCRGPVGTMKKGEPYSGYVRNFRYDPRLLHKAPPNFPSSGYIEVISVK